MRIAGPLLALALLLGAAPAAAQDPLVAVRADLVRALARVDSLRALPPAKAETVTVVRVDTFRVGAAYSPPPSIDATGTDDVTTALLAWIGTVPDSSTIRLPAGARYRVEGTLLLRNRYGLTIEAAGATLVATTTGADAERPAGVALRSWPRVRSHVSLVGGGGYVIRGLTIRGAHPFGGVGDSAYVEALEAQHGVNAIAVRGLVLDSITITDIYGDFVYLGHAGDEWTSDVRISGSRFERNGRQGIGIVGARRVRIEGNYIGQVRRAGVDIEPNFSNGGAVDVVVRNNTFGPGRLNWVSSQGSSGIVDDVTFEANRLVGRPIIVNFAPPLGNVRTRIRFLDNVSDTVFGSTQAPFRFLRVSGLEVRGNVQPLAARREMVGIDASEVCGAELEGNTFAGAIADSKITPSTDCPEVDHG